MPRCSVASKGGCSPCSPKQGCAWLRSRRVKNAALLTHPARHAVLNLSGRRASRHIDAKTPAGVASNKGRLVRRLPTSWQSILLAMWQLIPY